jgi:hypothetical protein
LSEYINLNASDNDNSNLVTLKLLTGEIKLSGNKPKSGMDLVYTNITNVSPLYTLKKAKKGHMNLTEDLIRAHFMLRPYHLVRIKNFPWLS